MKLVGINTVVFDFDGTLATCPYDFQKMRRAVLAAVHEHGIDPALVANLGLLETVEAGTTLLGEDQLRAETFRVDAMTRLGAIEMEAAILTRLLPGAVEALQRLRAAGYKLGIVTRNSVTAVKMIIGDAPLPFDAMLCREDVRNPKPHPEHVLQMLHLLDSAPELSLMVGDHPMDIEMGHAAHMRTIAVPTGQSTRADLLAAQPDLLLDDVVALAGLLVGTGTVAVNQRQT
jgi:phosphoglycolate phosphatase